MGIMAWRLRWRLVKVCLCVVLLWVCLAHFLPSWGEMEAVERIKVKQERHERIMTILEEEQERRIMEEEEEQIKKKKHVAAAINDIEARPRTKNKDKGQGYTNSQTLQVIAFSKNA